MRKQLYFSLVLLILSPNLIAADKAGVIVRDASLYTKPFKDADIISEISATTSILVLKRKGGWYEIKVTDKHGWVRLTRVRLNRKNNSADQQGSNGVGELLISLATGRDKSSEDTTATAVKGLSEEELRNAEPDVEALNALDDFAVSDDNGENSGLQTRQIAFQSDITKPSKTISPTVNIDDEEDEY